jgi:transposase
MELVSVPRPIVYTASSPLAIRAKAATISSFTRLYRGVVHHLAKAATISSFTRLYRGVVHHQAFATDL